ncbi:MAG: hypothetical protein ACRCV5_17735 [Afipia sp.]
MSKYPFQRTQTAYFRRMNWTNHCPCCRRQAVIKACESRSVQLTPDCKRIIVRGRCTACDSLHTRFEDERHTFDVQLSFYALQAGMVDFERFVEWNGSSPLAEMMDQQRENQG